MLLLPDAAGRNAETLYMELGFRGRSSRCSKPAVALVDAGRSRSLAENCNCRVRRGTPPWLLGLLLAFWENIARCGSQSDWDSLVSVLFCDTNTNLAS